MNDQSKTAYGLDKIERYKWEMSDSPGVLANVSKHDIKFDHDYQRSKNNDKIIAIAKDWSWLAMGVITIADRGGQLFAVDGMHRVSAALLRSDIDTLPCIIFKSKGIFEEAKGFVQANTLRKAISTYDKHRALVVAGDENAIFVQQLIDKEGFVYSTGSGTPNGVKCYGVLHKLAKTKREGLVKIWPIVCEVCRNRIISERILEGLVFIAERGNEDITSSKWSKVILSIGYDGLLQAANSAAAYYAKGGSKVWADGILQVMNKGRRNRLELNDA
jgi:hypothetical protein